MRWARWVRAILLALLWPAASAAAQPSVLDVRVGVHPDMTRVVIDLTEAPGYRIFTLADPYRVVIDLTEVGWQLPDGRVPAGRGFIQSLRFGLFAPGTSRVVLDLSEPTRVRQVQLLPSASAAPVRLVIDLEEADEASFIASIGAAPIVSSAAMATPVAMVLPPPKPEPAGDDRPLVAIVAGHGGVDPGAIGRGARRADPGD